MNLNPLEVVIRTHKNEEKIDRMHSSPASFKSYISTQKIYGHVNKSHIMLKATVLTIALSVSLLAIVETISSFIYVSLLTIAHTATLFTSKKLQNHLIKSVAYCRNSFLMIATPKILLSSSKKTAYEIELQQFFYKVHCAQLAQSYGKIFDFFSRRNQPIDGASPNKIHRIEVMLEELPEFISRTKHLMPNVTDDRGELIEPGILPVINQTQFVKLLDQLEGIKSNTIINKRCIQFKKGKKGKKFMSAVVTALFAHYYLNPRAEEKRKIAEAKAKGEERKELEEKAKVNFVKAAEVHSATDYDDKEEIIYPIDYKEKSSIERYKNNFERLAVWAVETLFFPASFQEIFKFNVDQELIKQARIYEIILIGKLLELEMIVSLIENKKINRENLKLLINNTTACPLIDERINKDQMSDEKARIDILCDASLIYRDLKKDVKLVEILLKRILNQDFDINSVNDLPDETKIKILYVVRYLQKMVNFMGDETIRKTVNTTIYFSSEYKILSEFQETIENEDEFDILVNLLQDKEYQIELEVLSVDKKAAIMKLFRDLKKLPILDREKYIYRFYNKDFLRESWVYVTFKNTIRTAQELQFLKDLMIGGENVGSELDQKKEAEIRELAQSMKDIDRFYPSCLQRFYSHNYKEEYQTYIKFISHLIASSSYYPEHPFSDILKNLIGDKNCDIKQWNLSKEVEETILNIYNQMMKFSTPDPLEYFFLFCADPDQIGDIYTLFITATSTDYKESVEILKKLFNEKDFDIDKEMIDGRKLENSHKKCLLRLYEQIKELPIPPQEVLEIFCQANLIGS